MTLPGNIFSRIKTVISKPAILKKLSITFTADNFNFLLKLVTLIFSTMRPTSNRRSKWTWKMWGSRLPLKSYDRSIWTIFVMFMNNYRSDEFSEFQAVEENTFPRVQPNHLESAFEKNTLSFPGSSRRLLSSWSGLPRVTSGITCNKLVRWYGSIRFSIWSCIFSWPRLKSIGTVRLC